MLAFFLTSTAILGAGHIYIAFKIMPFLLALGLSKTMGFSLILPGALFMPALFFWRFNSPFSIPSWLYTGVYIHFGLVSTLFALLLARDMFHLAIYTGQSGWNYLLNPSIKSSQSSSLLQSRREFLEFLTAGVTLGSAFLLTGAGYLIAHQKPIIRRVKLGSTWKITQFSDLHLSPSLPVSFINEIVSSLNQTEPDFFVFTGDLVDGTVEELEGKARLLTQLNAPVYWVTGNHEYYSGAENWINFMSQLGWQYLHNSGLRFSKKGKNLYLCGVPDITGSKILPSHISDPQKALSGSLPDDFKILLAHQPRSAPAAEKAGAHLQLSGHTHNGQYFPYNTLIRLAQPYGKGLHSLKQMKIYVNPGTGYWGPPNRVGVPPEITVFEVG